MSILETDGLLAPVLNPTTGTVLIDNKTSYSGVDIKAVVHVYDGGKAAQDQIASLVTSIANLTRERNAAVSALTALEHQITIRFTSDDVTKINNLHRQVLSIQNAIDALTDEQERVGKLKPKFSTKVLAELQTISISTHREKFPVRALGATYPKAFTRGPRTIAGSMIFTVFDQNVLTEFLDAHPSDFDAFNQTTSALIDQIPPFDITIAFANELGQVSRMTIYGVEFVNEGQTMSIEDLLLENVCQFVARDVDPMRSVSRRKLDENNRMTQQIIPLRGSALLDEANYQEHKNKISPFERYKNRNNPFV